MWRLAIIAIRDASGSYLAYFGSHITRWVESRRTVILRLHSAVCFAFYDQENVFLDWRMYSYRKCGKEQLENSSIAQSTPTVFNQHETVSIDSLSVDSIWIQVGRMRYLGQARNEKYPQTSRFSRVSSVFWNNWQSRHSHKFQNMRLLIRIIIGIIWKFSHLSKERVTFSLILINSKFSADGLNKQVS